MLPDEILSIEISLLLIKYGEKRVLKSLSKVLGIDIKDLNSKLQCITEIKKKDKVVNSQKTSRGVNDIIKQNPQKADLLNILYDRYLNKTFLPELRDIKRLLNRHSIDTKAVKQRNSAASKVFKLLASLEEKELQDLTQQQDQDRANFSSLGIISDQILGHKE